MIDLLARRREMMAQAQGGGLPDGYTQKEWLVSNGAYTSLALNLQYFTLETSLMWTSLGSNQLIGNGSSFFGLNTSNGWRTNGMAQSTSIADFGTADTTSTYTITYKRTSSAHIISNNGVTHTTSANAASAGYIFIFNIQNSNTYRCRAKMGITKIYDANNALVSHLIPCIDSNNVSGMYDVVRQIFISHNTFTTE